MAITRSQHNQTAATSGTSVTCAFSSSVAVGDLIVVWTRLGSGTGSSTISDNVNSGNYSKAKEVFVTSFGRFVTAYKVATSAGTPTITVTGDVSGTTRIAIAHYNGWSSGGPVFDQVNEAHVSSANIATASSGSVTITASNSLLCGMYGGNAGTPTATSTSSLNIFETVNTSKLVAADSLGVGAGTYSADWSLSPSNVESDTESQIITFMDTVATTAPPLGSSIFVGS